MPEQHDPINELSRFGSGFSNGSTGGDMSLSAADVRRRGDQIRRRRTALVAGGAALAVAAVTVPILALAGGSPRGEAPAITKDPNDAALVLGQQNLLTDDDTVYSDGADWFATDTFAGDGQAAFHLCARESLSGLGATVVFQRDFELRNTEQLDGEAPPEVKGDAFRQAIAQFPDAATAAAAYDTIAGWIEDCTEAVSASDAPDYRYLQTYDADTGLDSDSQAVILDAHYGPVPEDIDPFGDAAYIAETGLVRVGDRIAVLGSVIVGQDYNFLPEDGGTPVNRMIPTAAARLQADGPDSTEPAPGDPSEPSPSEGEASSVLAPGFDLVADMVTNDSGDPVVADPTAEGVGVLDFCSNIVDPGADAVERLAANASGPEYAEAREVIVTSSKADADALAATILSAARACPEPAASGSTSRIEVTTREDQPMPTDVIVQTYLTDGVPQLGTATWVVSHEGPIVFVAMTASEGNPEPEALQQSTDEFLDRLATPFGWIVDSVGS